jgi:hypothetical protein
MVDMADTVTISRACAEHLDECVGAWLRGKPFAFDRKLTEELGAALAGAPPPTPPQD